MRLCSKRRRLRRSSHRCVALRSWRACWPASPFRPASALLRNRATTAPSPRRESAQHWNLTLGAGLRYQPDYSGSNDYVFRPRPIISLGTRREEHLVGGRGRRISIGFFSGKGWRVGFSGNLLWERKASTNPALVAVPDTKFGFEAGGFAEFYPASWLRARVDLRRGFIAHDALVAELKLDAIARVGQWSFGAGPRMSIVGADYLRTYFGSYPGVAGTGGLLQRYNAGIHSYGAIAQATYNWSERLSTTTYIEYKRLVGDAAKSPIVRTYGSRDSITLGISASYAFDLGF
jgi:outer membrane protein